jgi:hypothetical protein
MALSAPRDTKEMASPLALRHQILGGTSQDFYVGQLVAIDPADGRLYPAVAADTTLIVVGRCEETYSTGASETTKKIKCKSGIFAYASGTAGEAIAADDRGKVCYVLDDESVGISGNSAANAVAGTVYDVDSYGVWVATFFPVSIRGPVGPTGPTGPGA